ncbi:hypothetical protein ACFR9U_13145 [Halorientalis brevis]|uniref:YgiT-type zinc finger domain-containing protein n=1 Tax=Halorientalis brevis TaxID=1126241 RepID=A0ABD6CDS0_9EURY|nr:hypothetical protein [Halorientalis brevis]
MSSLDDLPETVPALTCTRCDEPIERGYVTATRAGETYQVTAETAVCDTCGWADVGATGCAPTLSDFQTGDLLVRVERGDGVLVPASITDEQS